MQGTIQETPKPLEIEFDGNRVRAVFKTDELRRFIAHNDEAGFIVEDKRGHRAIILIQPIREMFEDTHPRL